MSDRGRPLASQRPHSCCPAAPAAAQATDRLLRALQFGWDAFFTTLIGACAIAVLLLAPISNAKSFVQREALAAKAA